MRTCPHCLSPYAQPVEFCGIDGTRLVEVDDDPLVGSDVDRYRILQHLGDGGMARVYRVRHHVLARELAMKVLFGEYAANKTLAERFRREATTMSKIVHENVVGVSDFGRTQAGLTFLAMELVPGRTLRRTVKTQGAFDAVRAANIARQIARGLEAAHELGFVHRDLKPGNVMLVQQPDFELVKILDFGLARMADGDEQELYLTKTGQFLGTPIYMAPEQIIGADVDHRADLYALGVVLFEMLEGRPPFKAKKLAEIRHKHLVEPPPPVRPSCGLEDIAAALLSKTAAERPESTADVVAMIDALGITTGEETEELSSSIGSAPIAAEMQDAAEKTIRTSMPDEITKRVSLEGVNVTSVPAAEAVVGDGPTRPAILRAQTERSNPEDDDDAFEPVALTARLEVSPVEVAPDPAHQPRLDSSVAALDASRGDSFDLSAAKSPGRRALIWVLPLGAIFGAGTMAWWLTSRQPSPAAPPPASPAIVAADPKPNPEPAPVAKPEPQPEPPPVAKPEPQPEPAPVAKPEPKKRNPKPPPKRRTQPTAKATRAKLKRRLDAAIASAIDKRGLQRADVETESQTKDAWSRWRTARSQSDTTAMQSAADDLLAQIRSYEFGKTIVDRRLDRVSSRLARAAKTLPPETLRPFEDRYLTLVSRVTPGLTPKQAKRIVAEANALLADLKKSL